MPSPTFTGFAQNLQNEERLNQGLAFGNSADKIEELWRCIPILVQPGIGESLTVGNTTDVSALSSFKAIGAPPSGGTPGSSGVTFNFRRAMSLSEPDVTLIQANQDPNSILDADNAARKTSLLRLLGETLLNGDDTDANGFLGWENMVDGTSRTSVPFIGPGAGQVLETLYRIDDTCASGPLGNRASAFVTTPHGRRNIIRAAQLNGFDLEYRLVHGLTTEVPYFAGRPVIATSADLTDPQNPNQIPVYAVDFSYVFIVATTGSSRSRGIEVRRMQLQTEGSVGFLKWFHGACLIRHPAALVRSLITVSLSS